MSDTQPPIDAQTKLAAAAAIAHGVPEREMIVLCARALASTLTGELEALRAELVAVRMALQTRAS